MCFGHSLWCDWFRLVLCVGNSVVFSSISAVAACDYFHLVQELHFMRALCRINIRHYAIFVCMVSCCRVYIRFYVTATGDYIIIIIIIGYVGLYCLSSF